MIIKTADDMERLGETLAETLTGGQVIELVGDVGAGKTTLIHGIARGLGIDEIIVSPSFTINCNYSAPNGLVLHHYDFYRLSDPGIVALELAETINDPNSITVIEWADSIHDVLPEHAATIQIDYNKDTGRTVHARGIALPNTIDN